MMKPNKGEGTPLVIKTKNGEILIVDKDKVSSDMKVIKELNKRVMVKNDFKLS